MIKREIEALRLNRDEILSEKRKLEGKPLRSVTPKDLGNFPLTFTSHRHYVHISLRHTPRFEDERKVAERLGLPMHVFVNADELPSEAFL